MRKIRKEPVIQSPLVVKGCFRMYAIDDNGAEHNLQFAAENEWIADIDIFYSDKPSKLFIEAIEPSTIIHYRQMSIKVKNHRLIGFPECLYQLIVIRNDTLSPLTFQLSSYKIV